jgi:hypothetical protein
MIVQALTTASNAATLTSLVFTIFFGIDLLFKQISKCGKGVTNDRLWPKAEVRHGPVYAPCCREGK